MSYGIGVDPGKRRAGVAVFDLDTKRIVSAGLVVCPDKEEGPLAAVLLASTIVDWITIPNLPYPSYHIRQLVVEWPRTYGGRAGVGDANDLLSLAALDGALAMALRRISVLHANTAITHYMPQEWGATGKPDKTSKPYPVETKVRSRLSPTELQAINWPTNKTHSWDVTDAIAIALKWLGRFERVSAFARE